MSGVRITPKNYHVVGRLSRRYASRGPCNQVGSVIGILVKCVSVFPCRCRMTRTQEVGLFRVKSTGHLDDEMWIGLRSWVVAIWAPWERTDLSARRRPLVRVLGALAANRLGAFTSK